MINILIPTTPDRRERVLETIASIHEHCSGMEYAILIYENQYIGWANAVRNMVDKLYARDKVILLESDVIVHAGWLQELEKTWKVYGGEYQSNLVLEPQNDLHNGNLIQHPFCRVSILQQYISREYFHAYADNEMNDRIKENCKFVYVPTALLEHKHYLVGKAEKDKGYEVANDPVRVEKDRETYKRRKDNHYL